MRSKYDSVRLGGLGVALPTRIVTSDQIEEMLAPLYGRLGLRVGRLELMTGIRERRWGEVGLRPSDLSSQAGRAALRDAGVEAADIGCVVHTSVCRDFLEPATATVVHDALGLPPSCEVFDLSNACLGWLSGLACVANMIELGQIEAGLVVSGEDGRALVESTIEALNTDTSATRQSIKSSFASLTIGAGGVAAVLTSERLSNGGHRLLGFASEHATQFNHLCQGGVGSGESTRTGVSMNTDSEAMLHEGVALAARTWASTRELLDWTPTCADHFITHQVGTAHRRLMFERLELDMEKDFPTVETLGNIGSASIGTTLAMANQAGRLKPDDRALLMGIGSGLVCMMVGVQW